MENKQKPKRQQIEFEFEGRTIEEALQKALESLRVGRDALEVKVLSEEARGLFGMAGSKPARIRVKIKK